MKATIYYNPRCSKSRATLALLEDRGVELQIVEYLVSPPSSDTLQALVEKLGISLRDLIRSGEAEFAAANVDLDSATSEEILALLTEIPKLIQRPIVEVDQGARIGRPPEAVLELFE
ncbi:MAG: arsenate reductase (glutaredoxin) [Candidatus Rariloculaceae bacterium]